MDDLETYGCWSDDDEREYRVYVALFLRALRAGDDDERGDDQRAPAGVTVH
jgi:hypothetical protein